MPSSKRRAPLQRALTSRFRLLPDFLIIGAQRGGTTSLYNYLAAHPCVWRARRKEVHFFDLNFARGAAWYRSHFPLALSKRLARLGGRHIITGEGSPYYIFHPLAPRRAAQTLPAVKLVALLRNPVERAYSHYHLEKRKGRETLSFEDAIEQEAHRLSGETEKLSRDPDYHSAAHQRFSYLARGLYAEQLAAWLEVFPREQMLVIQSEEFYAEPGRIVAQTLEFLLPQMSQGAWSLQQYPKYNEASYQTLQPALRRHLNDFFRPHNQKLSELLGRRFDWDE